MTDNLYCLDSCSSEEDASCEKYSEATDRSSKCSYSEGEDLSKEIHTSNINIDSDREIEEDKRLIFLFYALLFIKMFLKSSMRCLDLFPSIQRLISNYSQVSYGILPTEIDYTKESLRIGYLYRYAACHAALVFSAVSDIFDSSDVLSSKLYKKRMNVMFLGGGSGDDFVGFLTALYSHHHHLFDLDVTIAHKMSGWKDVFNKTVKYLRRNEKGSGKAGSVFEEVNITTTFISTDLRNSEEWDESMHAKLQNADMVFFVKALSHIPDGDKLQALQNVVTCMKLESHLIYIDYPYPYRVFLSLSHHLRTVYQAWEMRYSLGHKDVLFGCSNISSCRAVVKVFARYEDDYSNLYF